MQHQKILILDFGSQVTQLIARRVREAHVFCEVHPCDVTSDWVRDYAKDGNLKGVILSGSHASVYEVEDRAPDAVFELGVPVLGICYGMQTMAQQLGGKVEAGKTREFGYAEVRAHGHTALLESIEDFATPEGHGMLKVWMSHGDKVTELPPGFKLMASTPSCAIAGMADEVRKFYAVQFHAEKSGEVGSQIIENFIRKEPRIAPVRGRLGEPAEQEDLALRSQPAPIIGGLVTESFAKILCKQGKYSKAIDIYEKLALKNPDKTAYFAAKISEIKGAKPIADS